MSQHTMEELRTRQAYPLDLKIKLTEARIRGWINEYGEDGVYVSFSGGKDSTVLMDIIRNRMGYKEIPAMFVDVPTQYPELREFAQTWDNVDIIKPKISFMQVCEKYGFPLISKEVSEALQGARKYLPKLKEELGIEDLNSEQMSQSEELNNLLNERLQRKLGGQNYKLAVMLGTFTKEGTIKAGIDSSEKSLYCQGKWKFLLDAKFDCSNRCCNIMKKEPAHRYSKETGRKPITAQMAEESRLRMTLWLKNGCNGFNMKSPVSNPMSFWTEQDVLKYIYENHLPICSAYGEVVCEQEGQLTFENFGKQETYRTTGCNRTGCMLCGFGCHLEKKEEARFVQLKQTHEKMYNLLDIIQNNGVTYREAIEWTNEHLKDNQKIPL